MPGQEATSPQDGELEEIALRVEHPGLHIPGQVLLLDLYRLLCYFHSSERLSTMSDGGDFCPWQSFRDAFESSEIVRILLQTAVSVRFIGQGHADKLLANQASLKENVGSLFKNVELPDAVPLALREACNKIVHAHNIIIDSNNNGNPYKNFLKPRIFCFECFEKRRGWRADIDLVAFINQCQSIIVPFGY